ncbi:MAG: extracellular solute-binding protein [Chloroflexota bacterium]
MRTFRPSAAVGLAVLLVAGSSAATLGQGSPAPLPQYPGVTLNLAAQSDQFAAVLQKLAPDFEAATGAKVVVDILGYPELYSKVTADFVGHTGNYDLITTDIVWTGEFAQNGYTVDLKPLIDRDAAEIDIDDIYPVAWTLGGWGDQQIAFPMAGYANLLNYRQDVFDAAGIEPPTTMEQLRDAAKQLTDASKNQYGITINGQTGAAGAQDWMAYNAQLGGSLLDEAGKPTLNSAANVANLDFFKSLFEFAPPGAFDYDWGARETSFKNGTAMMQEGWSVARPGTTMPASPEIVGKVGTVQAPTAEGMEPTYGFGGWGIAINKDSTDQDAAWTFIKWLTSEPIQKQWVLDGSGSYIRRSTLADPDLLAAYPWQDKIATSFENGDGDYRPRIPQYSRIQDALGLAVNDVLHGNKTSQEALDEAQAAVEPLFP